MADHHPQQAQKEEHGHQDKGDVVRLGFENTAFPRRRRLTGWRSEREDRLQIILNVKLIVIAMSLRQHDIPSWERGHSEAPGEAAVGI